MDIILKGILSGLVLAVLIGPVFFTIIQTSIEKGFGTGVRVALGVSLSDTCYIFLTYLGISQLLDNYKFKVYMSYAGGLILVGFGVYYLFIKSRRLRKNSSQELTAKSSFRYVLKGFVINGLTPMVLVFWVGAVSFATGELGYVTSTQAIVYFSSLVVTVFTTDVLKAKLADKLRILITPGFFRWLNIALGILFIIFGARLILFAGHI